MNITNTKGLHSESIKCLVYGRSGAGKTHLLGTGENDKTLIISAESGLLSLGDKEIGVVTISEWKDIQKVYAEFLHNDELEKYTTIGIDSLTELSDLLVKTLEKIPEFQDPKNTFKLWGEFNKRIISIIKAFRDLPNKNIIFTALAEDIKDGGVLIKAPMISGSKAQGLLASFFDEVFYLDVNEATNERILHTANTLSFVAKDRSGKLEQIETPNLIAIFNKIKGQDNAPVRAVATV